MSVTVPLWLENFCSRPPAAALSEGSRTLTLPSMSPAIISLFATDIEFRGTSHEIVRRGWCILVLSYMERLLFRIFSKCVPTSHRSTLVDLHPLVVARIPGPIQTVEFMASNVLMVTLGGSGGGALMAKRLARSQTWQREVIVAQGYVLGNQSD